MKDKDTVLNITEYEVARLQHNLANQALRSRNRHMGWEHLYQMLNCCASRPSYQEGDALFVTASLEFSDLSFALGQGFNYYFFQGIFPVAKSYFEIAARNFESVACRHIARNPSGPMWLSYCYAFLGHIHETIGKIDYYRRLAIDRSKFTLAIAYRSVMALILLMEALYHANGALREAVTQQNAMAIYFAKGVLTCCSVSEGRFREADEISNTNITCTSPL